MIPSGRRSGFGRTTASPSHWSFLNTLFDTVLAFEDDTLAEILSDVSKVVESRI